MWNIATGQVTTFHVDRVVSTVAGEEIAETNLELACVSCSLRKGSRQQVEDAETGEIVMIFDPRQQAWEEHFVWQGVQVVGLTATGRATVQALDLSRPRMMAIRAEEELLGRHPSP